jgi:hypothetical protein
MPHREDDTLRHEIFYIIIRKLLWCNSHHDWEEFCVRGNYLELSAGCILDQMLAMNTFFDSRNKWSFQMNAYDSTIETIFLSPFFDYLQCLLSVLKYRCY